MDYREGMEQTSTTDGTSMISISAKKTGAWQEVLTGLQKLPRELLALNFEIFDYICTEYQNAIKEEIIRRDIHPDDNLFTAKEYSDRVMLIQLKPQETFIGIEKEEVINGKRLDTFAVRAEYEDGRYLGAWRSTTERFIRRLPKLLKEWKNVT